MKIFTRVLTPAAIFFLLTLSVHAMFGKGEIKIDSDFKEGYQGYLQALKENKGWTGSFAADNNGAWGWSLADGPNEMSRASQGAVENCNEYSTTKACRLFARNNNLQFNRIFQSFYKIILVRLVASYNILVFQMIDRAVYFSYQSLSHCKDWKFF